MRQFFTYRRRMKTFLPTKSRNRPNDDFVAMRKRIKLRDIFWYRKKASEEVTPPPGAPPNKPEHVSRHDPEVKFSALDRVERGIASVARRGGLGRDRVNNLQRSEEALVGDDIALQEIHSAGASDSSVKRSADGSESNRYPETYLSSQSNASDRWPSNTRSGWSSA